MGRVLGTLLYRARAAKMLHRYRTVHETGLLKKYLSYYGASHCIKRSRSIDDELARRIRDVTTYYMRKYLGVEFSGSDTS